MNGLTFDETVERYAWLSGLPIEVAREQMRQQLYSFVATVIPSAERLAHLLGTTLVDNLAAGFRPYRRRLPRRAARRVHSRKVKRG